MHRDGAEEQQPGVGGGVPQEGHPPPRGRRGHPPQARDLPPEQFSVRFMEIPHRKYEPAIILDF